MGWGCARPGSAASPRDGDVSAGRCTSSGWGIRRRPAETRNRRGSPCGCAGDLSNAACSFPSSLCLQGSRGSSCHQTASVSRRQGMESLVPGRGGVLGGPDSQPPTVRRRTFGSARPPGEEGMLADPSPPMFLSKPIFFLPLPRPFTFFGRPLFLDGFRSEVDGPERLTSSSPTDPAGAAAWRGCVN